MAIKIKHEGNATSRLAASAAGGRGRRRAEDAKAFLQIASQEEMANRRIQTPQMVQAHATAPGSAPLVNAPSGGGGASLMSAPSIPQPHPVQNRGGGDGSSPVTSPGGRKKGMRGSTAERGGMAGMQGGKLFVNESTGDMELRDGRGEVMRRYSKDQFDHLKRRGNAGATMDAIDQQAWFRYNGGKTQQELEEEERQRKAAQIADQRSREDEVFKRNNEEYDRRFQMEADAKAVAERDRFERDELRRAQEEERRKQEKLSARAQAERDKAAEDVIQGIKDNRFEDFEIPQLMEEFKEYEDRIKVADRLRRKPPTAQEQFDERRVTVNGKEGYIGARGDFIPFDDGSEAERELRKQELEQAKEEKRQAQRNAYILKSVEAAEKEWSLYDHKDDEMFDADAVIKAAGDRYDKVYGGSQPKDDEGDEGKGRVNVEGAQPLPSVEVAAAYAQYLNGEEEPPAQPAPTQAARQPATSEDPAVTVEDAKKKWGVK